MKRTLKKGYQFRRVFRTGKKFRGKSFRAIFVLNTLGTIRLGFSISAKSGNAVSRNLMKRRLRSLAAETEVGADVVIFPVGKLGSVSWREVREDFGNLVERIIEDVRKGSR
jgi:ribonuclease P protein component